MATRKVLVITEMSFQGSGYYYLMSPILDRMAESGMEVRVIGLSYDGTEHKHKFSIVKAESIQDSVAIAKNMIALWQPDVVISGIDIPLQLAIHASLPNTKYIAVTPLENPPLTQSWAAGLMAMTWVWFISECGYNAAVKAGLSNVGHIHVGVDTESMYPPTVEERKQLRDDFGITDEFVILTVADNQERKNLWAAMEIVSRVKKDGKKVKYILVTRENSPVGHKLRDLAINLDINKEFTVIERGISREELRKLYVSSDLFLLTSKAEGYGLPVLESLACGLPVVATDTGAITEVLANGRGYLIPAGYEFIDVWGNSLRSMIDVDVAEDTINWITSHGYKISTKPGLEYAQAQTFDIPARQMIEKIMEITDEK